MSAPTAPATDASLTSKDYYFDSYAHFGKLLYCFHVMQYLKLDLTFL